ncbi:MAG: hypothetical protein J6T44_10695 [Prevotella sp.]|nr:hypothetical protein [Prevotella sp.]
MIYYIRYDGARHKLACPVKDRTELMRLRHSSQNRRNLKNFHKGDKKAKTRLLQLAYNARPVNGRLAGCKHIGSFFFHDVDCYDQQQSLAYKDLILSKKDEIGLMMLERSASGGWHLVCRRERGKTILENQVRVASILKIEMDTSAHDLQRVVFSTSGSEEDLPYLDDALFEEPMSVEESAAEYQALSEREANGEEELPEGAKQANKHYRPWEEHTGTGSSVMSLAMSQRCLSPVCEPASVSPQTYPSDYHGIPFTAILKRYWEVNNKGFEPTEGDRDTLTFQLASDLRHICGKNPDWLDQVIPCYDNFPIEEKRQKIKNALSSKFEAMPQRLKVVLESLEREKSRQGTSSPETRPVIEDVPPEMPEPLPALIDLLVSRTPDIYKAAVAHAVFPSLAVHLWKVYFRYIDNKRHEATLMNCLMAGTGAGKDCISDPIDHIMADIRERDAENMRREKAWKNEVNSKGANKDKKQRPEGLVIQEIDADMTNPAFVMRTAEAEEHFLYVKLNEIDQFDALKGNGRTGSQFQIMCLAFDPNNRYGQTRIGTQSITERVQIRFNWNAATTIQKGQRYFQRVLTDGPISRINFCTIPEREIGAEIPRYGEYDAAFDEALKPYIERLCAARGDVDCPEAFVLAERLCRECAEFAQLSQSRTYENLSFRANVIAWLKACVLYVANGCQWDERFEPFIRWSLQYDMWCKMHFFGAAIENANNVMENGSRRGPQNLLTLLPEVFSRDDADRIRKQEGLGSKGTAKMISQWKTRGYILQLTVDSFQNLRFKG